MEFHISRKARERYQFDRDLYQPHGRIQRPDLLAIHDLVWRMNAQLVPQGRGVKAGQLFGLALIQYILHRMLETYRVQRVPDLFAQTEHWLKQQDSMVEQHWSLFGEHYAPLVVFRRHQQLDDYLADPLTGVKGLHVLIEQQLLIQLANENPAAESLRNLYDTREYPRPERFSAITAQLEQFLAIQPPFGPENERLPELLRAPLRASPDSLRGQLEYIRNRWASYLDPEILLALLTAEDLAREEERAMGGGPMRTGPDEAYLRALASRAAFAGYEHEPERFSADTEWMPRVVLIAKSIYVWLDQLSRKYGRIIRRLDQIPDEELDLLASWGITGLWLIGIWERSEASRKIKHLRGNVDAVASAYSLWDYRVSGDLGGDDALENLKSRALARGIRLACDLVPNHMGIDSRWVREHPDWFLQLDYPPFPAYRYEGPDLSGDPRYEIKIEDGYWNGTDAAVVFRLKDRHSGRTRFVYHGNDGTSMPWNDTAQLNFMRADVREAVVQLILSVARKCPIMRFDAAMTLTKKHFQRLWFPEPGTGGAIPSRAMYGLTKEEFDRQMPGEFWREVVDRVAAEAPDTLLLAEAFWLLEGFFVRTLGMHRVYNSAFMNMLKLEENAKYRSVIKNTLEFDPRVLQRFVNFMNNPDEDTAVAQFGKGDKYFGVALMMATMPGLPMFGHGQVEGLTEKYGHEYQRAYYDERPDDDLVRRHEREIFPILRQRHLFSGAEHFLLYDVYRENGSVDENVFAFSNGYGDARALVVFHNRWAETAGWIHTSAAFSVSDGAGGRRLTRKTLAEGLGFRSDPGRFYVLRDRIAGVEYLRRGSDLVLHGLHVQLRAYQYQVFTEFREIMDDGEGRFSRLCEALAGRGVPSVDHEYKRMYLAPLLEAFRKLATAEQLRALMSPAALTETGTESPQAAFMAQAIHFANSPRNAEEIAEETRAQIARVLMLPAHAPQLSQDSPAGRRMLSRGLAQVPDGRWDLSQPLGRILAGWLCAWAVTRLHLQETTARAAQRFDDWLMGEMLIAAFRELGASEDEAWREAGIVRVILGYADILETFAAPRKFTGIAAMLDDSATRAAIGYHLHAGVEWFHRESLERLLEVLFVVSVIQSLKENAELEERRIRLLENFSALRELAAISEYRMDRLRTLLGYAA